MNPARHLNQLPLHPAIGSTEIHIWLAGLNRPDLIPAGQAILSSDESARAQRYRFERDRTCFFARHFFLRTLLSDYLGRPARDLEIRLTSSGRPYLEGHPVHFNVSDSGDRCLLAFTHLAPLGVDLEAVRTQTDIPGIARRFFSAAEQAELAGFPLDLQTEAFYHIWTQKEAFIKATGEGMSLELDSFDVEADPNRPGGIRAVRGTGLGSGQMRSFVPMEGFRAAVFICTEMSPRLLTFKV